MNTRLFSFSLLSVVLLQVVGCAHKSSSNRNYSKKPATTDADTARIQNDDDRNDDDDRRDDDDGRNADEWSQGDDSDDQNDLDRDAETDVGAVDPNATCYKGDATICQIEEAITRKTNELRAKNGREPLTHSPKFSFIARDWSATQGQRRRIGHDGFPNQRNSAYAQEFGSRASMNAENVAYSSQGSGDVEAVASVLATMWANSFGHRINMLGRYSVIGVGVWKNGNTYYGTQIFGEE